MRKLLLTLLLLAGLFAALSSSYTVDRTEYVYLTQFGRPLRTLDGAKDAGLHFKLPWPIQTVQRLDHRLQYFDLPAAELPTRDLEGKSVDKMLSVVGYVCWKIDGEEGVDRFIRTVGSPDRAQEILGQRVRSRLGAEIGSMQLDDLVKVASAKVVEERMDRLQKKLLGAEGQEKDLKALAKNLYGIDIVDIRLRRFNYPPQVHSAIYARITSEREKKVAEFVMEGETKAKRITSDAVLEAQKITTSASAEKEKLEKEADIKAKEILSQAHAKDWQFFLFLENLKNGQSILGAGKDVLVLSGRSEIFDFLFKPPKPNGSTNGGKSMSPLVNPSPPTPKPPALPQGEKDVRKEGK